VNPQAVSIIVALIGCASAIGAALITNHTRGPAAVRAADPGVLAQPAAMGTTPGRVSRSLWLGLAGMLLWIIPVLGYLAVVPGLYIGIREHGGPRRGTAAGIALCSIGLAASLINSAVGAYQGAHGQAWFQS